MLQVPVPVVDIGASVQVLVRVPLVELKVPRPLLVQVTVPVGVIGPDDVSFTVAVHFVESESSIVLCKQLTVVEVVREGNTTTPILLPNASVNQTLPSGPAVIPAGPLPVVGTGYSVKTPLVVTLPILLPSS